MSKSSSFNRKLSIMYVLMLVVIFVGTLLIIPLLTDVPTTESDDLAIQSQDYSFYEIGSTEFISSEITSEIISNTSVDIEFDLEVLLIRADITKSITLEKTAFTDALFIRYFDISGAKRDVHYFYIRNNNIRNELVEIDDFTIEYEEFLTPLVHIITLTASITLTI